MGLPAYWGPATKVFIDILLTSTRILYANKQLEFFSLREYLIRVIVPILICITLVILPFIAATLLINSFGIKVLVTFTLLIYTTIVAYFIGLDKSEKSMAINMVKNIVARIK